MLAPFLTHGYEGFNVDDEDDWAQAERLVEKGGAATPGPLSTATRILAAREGRDSGDALSCDAGWRPWIFLKATTDDGLVGWAEITDSHGSPRGLAGIVEDLAPLVVGRDPRAVERHLLGSLPAHATEPRSRSSPKALDGHR